jgi:hypothetical protein
MAGDADHTVGGNIRLIDPIHIETPAIGARDYWR